MTCRPETLPPQAEKQLIPEARTHVDQRLSALINMALDNCGHQLSLHQNILTTIGESENFSNYFSLLHSAINNPIFIADSQNKYLAPKGGHLDSRKSIYYAAFIPESEKPQLPINSLQSIKECFLTISRVNDSTFDIKYSLMAREFGYIPPGHLTQKITYNPNSYQKLADININISDDSDPDVSLKLYSDSRSSSSFRSRCFQSSATIVLDENTETIREDICRYLSTLNLSTRNHSSQFSIL